MLKKNQLLTIVFSTCVIISSQVFAKPHSHHGVEVQKLQDIAQQRSEDERKRDKYRHPVETLSFFRITPDMKVAEALPGGGWYSKILSNYLSPNGALYGINYDDDMWARFGFFSEDFINERIASTGKFAGMVKEFTDGPIEAKGFTYATAPESLNGSLDRVLFIRALHNLNVFEQDAKTLSNALTTAHRLLKKDGMVGVVQHQIPESSPDKGATGRRGYMKLSTLKAAFKQAGFELVDQSDINLNPKDKPAETDVVWRLPPTYNGTSDDPAKKAAVDAIGESNRITLLFKKVEI